MNFRPEHYRIAAHQRASTARILWNQERYSAAIYMAGVAVECMLRAYVTRDDPQFDERHDLNDLFRRSGLEHFTTAHYRRQVSAWLGDVWTRWKNNYRYASDDRLRAEFKRLGFHWRMKGDFLKENARIVVDAALELTSLGEQQWNSKTN